VIRLSQAAHDQLFDHARRDAPIEACGYLGGRTLEDGTLEISRYLPLTNADGIPEHFSFLPAEQFAAVKTFRAAGLQALGIWHSHPVSPARPSEEDIRLAFDPRLVYFIATLLLDGGAAYIGQAGTSLPALRAYHIRNGVVNEESIQVY